MIKGRVLITGGSGTIGNAILSRATTEGWPARFTIYSRSEFLQAKMKNKYPNVDYVLGDIRDYDRLNVAMIGHNLVIHAAAMKRIPECENQVDECYKTNVLGSLNIIKAAKSRMVKRVIGLSTDKACNPVTAYGASKLMMERAFQAESGEQTIFTCLRYGNVIESRGSVIPIWKSKAANGEPLPVTDKRMTRFWITPHLAVDYILEAIKLPPRSIYVPKMKALPIIKMANYLCPGSQFEEIGLRSMERLHEYLVSVEETADDIGHGFVISPWGTMGHVWRSNTCPELDKVEFLGMVNE